MGKTCGQTTFPNLFALGFFPGPARLSGLSWKNKFSVPIMPGPEKQGWRA